jgi:hypothetical protein
MFNVDMVPNSIQSLPERLRTIALDLKEARNRAELALVSKFTSEKLKKIADELETFNSENAEVSENTEVNEDSEPCRYP